MREEIDPEVRDAVTGAISGFALAVIFWFIVWIAFCGSAHGQEKKASVARFPEVAFAASASADLASTLALRAPLREGNPVLGRRAARQVALSACAGAGVLYLARRFSHTHRKLANVLLWAGTAAHTGAAVWNIERGRK